MPTERPNFLAATRIILVRGYDGRNAKNRHEVPETIRQSKNKAFGEQDRYASRAGRTEAVFRANSEENSELQN